MNWYKKSLFKKASEPAYDSSLASIALRVEDRKDIDGNIVGKTYVFPDFKLILYSNIGHISFTDISSSVEQVLNGYMLPNKVDFTSEIIKEDDRSWRDYTFDDTPKNRINIKHAIEDFYFGGSIGEKIDPKEFERYI